MAWWRATVNSLCARAGSLQVLHGFAAKIIREERLCGFWPQMEARDLVNSALAKAWGGNIKRHLDERAHRFLRDDGDDRTRPSITLPRGETDPSDDERQAIRALCSSIRNECRSDARKWRRRERKHRVMIWKQSDDVSQQVVLRIELLAAVEHLPEMRRKAFVEIEMHGRSVDAFALQYKISKETVKTHLKHARRDLRERLGDRDHSSGDMPRDDRVGARADRQRSD